MRVIYLLLVFVSAILYGGCQSQKAENEKSPAAQCDALFKSYHEQDDFHGGVVITRNGEPFYEGYFGMADRTWRIPVSHSTKYDIASINKSMIAALVLKATEEEKLDLTDKLIDLLSNYEFSGEFHNEITVHHLLSHSSGLADYDAIPKALRKNNFLQFKRKHFTNAEYLDFISRIPPVNEPGKQFYYSNFAYHILAIILEDAYRKSFGEILEEKLTRPLGLTNTVSVSSNESIVLNLAKGYNYQAQSGEWIQNQFIDLTLGRRVFSTVSDLNRWALVMDNPGWLSAESLKLIQTNHLKGIDDSHSYGYGWFVINETNQNELIDLGINMPYIIHGGSTEGYKAMLININSGEYVISFLSNVGDKTNERKLAREIVSILMDKS